MTIDGPAATYVSVTRVPGGHAAGRPCDGTDYSIFYWGDYYYNYNWY